VGLQPKRNLRHEVLRRQRQRHAGPGELGIPGWHIEIDIPSNTTTDADGNYIFLDVPDGTYEVCEVIPALAPTWIPTTPTSISGIAVPPDSTGNDFGNVCLGPGGGKTLGFWSNKNGEKVITANGGLAIVNALPLVNGSGVYVPDFATHGAFKSWILSATATNMAYMLSAQLAAMKLNATIGDVNGGSYLLAGACGNTGIDNKFITVNDLIAARWPSCRPTRTPRRRLIPSIAQFRSASRTHSTTATTTRTSCRRRPATSTNKRR
jgi:hypothetical protein